MIFVYVFHQRLTNHFYLKNHKLISTSIKNVDLKIKKVNLSKKSHLLLKEKTPKNEDIQIKTLIFD